MRKLIVILAILLGTPAQAFEQDKIKHFGASAAISGLSYGMFKHVGHLNRVEAYAAAVVVSMTVGVAKEFTDDFVDKDDLKADALGSLLGPMLFISWEL